ncbi:hypothetical protein [Spirosoma aerolatum]|uniref:hypothetical protein n=1 Tax=Spirosoma aerolatum TaxID=1211326 RepID=UPI0009AE319D|nr:hypothetical protein [Spirosoma aerolatum]
MNTGFSKIKYYVLVVIIALGVFVWAGFTGTRLLGDDHLNDDTNNSYYGSSGRSYSSHRHFYHK